MCLFERTFPVFYTATVLSVILCTVFFIQKRVFECWQWMDSTPQPPHPSALLELYCTLISLIKQEVSLFLFNWICLKFPLRFLRMLLTTLDRWGGWWWQTSPCCLHRCPFKCFWAAGCFKFLEKPKKTLFFFCHWPRRITTAFLPSPLPSLSLCTRFKPTASFSGLLSSQFFLCLFCL